MLSSVMPVWKCSVWSGDRRAPFVLICETLRRDATVVFLHQRLGIKYLGGLRTYSTMDGVTQEASYFIGKGIIEQLRKRRAIKVHAIFSGVHDGCTQGI